MYLLYRYRYLIKLFRVLVLFASISLRLQSRQLRRLIEQNMLNLKKKDNELYLHATGPHRGWWVNVYLSTMSIHGAKAISSAASRIERKHLQVYTSGFGSCAFMLCTASEDDGTICCQTAGIHNVSLKNLVILIWPSFIKRVAMETEWLVLPRKQNGWSAWQVAYVAGLRKGRGRELGRETSRAPHVSLAPKTPFPKAPFPFPFKRLPRRLRGRRSKWKGKWIRPCAREKRWGSSPSP